MKLLDGRDLADFIKERHARQAPALRPRLVIIGQGLSPASQTYIRGKQRYGQDIGARVDLITATPADLLHHIAAANADPAVHGLIIQLPLAAGDLTAAALAAVDPAKDVDGLGPGSPFEAATPKAILWLLAAYNIDLKDRRIAVVGQGRLVGAPLSDRLEASGHEVTRIDEHTTQASRLIRQADIVITAAGQPGLITADMLQSGAVIVDAAAPRSDLAPDVLERSDLIRTPNPGGVGPVTVAALFDNLLIAAQTGLKKKPDR